MPYLSNGLADRREIWHGDAFWPSRTFPPLKCPHFQIPRWRRPPSWKKEMAISQQWFRWSARNSAWRRILAVLRLPAPTISTFLKSKMAAAAILKNRKMAISQQRFGRCREIWHGDGLWPSSAFSPLKFTHFKNPRWRLPRPWKIEKLKNRKMAISQQRFDWSKFGMVTRFGRLTLQWLKRAELRRNRSNRGRDMAIF